MALFDTLSIVKFCLIKLNVYLCIKNNKNIYMEKKLFILLPLADAIPAAIP